MQVCLICDQGTALRREDGFVVTNRIYGVVDGVSMPHSPKHPQKMFSNLSGGEMIARFYEDYLRSPAHVPLPQLMQEMSSELGHIQHTAGIPLTDAGLLAGATFACASLDADNRIRIMQAGDCMVIVELKGGHIDVSHNKVRAHDAEMNKEIERIQREVAQELCNCTLENVPDDQRGQVRGEAWDRVYPTLLEARRRNANRKESPQGYGILNGQPDLFDLVWERSFYPEDISTIILLTDGMIPRPVMELPDDFHIGRSILENFKTHGLDKLLGSVRKAEQSLAKTSYIDQVEATAVALTF